MPTDLSVGIATEHCKMKKINMNKYETIFEFTILWKGWEMDNTGWIKRSKSGKTIVVFTSHGDEYVGTLEDLNIVLQRHVNVVSELKEAVRLLSEPKE